MLDEVKLDTRMPWLTFITNRLSHQSHKDCPQKLKKSGKSSCGSFSYGMHDQHGTVYTVQRDGVQGDGSESTLSLSFPIQSLETKQVYKYFDINVI